MAKYPRKGTSVLGMNRTTLVWGIVAGLVLSAGSFTVGMYYGYYQGYSARQSEQQQASQDSTARVAESPSGNGAPSEDEFEAVITDEDLSETASEAENDAKIQRDTPSRESGDTLGEEATGSTDSVEVQANALSEGRPGTDASEPPASSSGSAGEAEEDGFDQPGAADEQRNQIVSTSGPTYSIQVVSYVEESRAIERRDELEAAGHNASITTKTINGRKRYRVRLGEFSSRQDAQKEAESLKENGVIEDYWISQITSE